jgi:tetratricopeptide (TPR) repeat protein
MLGRFSQGEAHLRRAVKLDPENTIATMWLGALIGGQGRLGEERVVLQQALEKDPLNQLVNINLASNDMRRGEFTEGMQRLQRLLEIFPTSTALLRTISAWAAGTGDHGQAFEYARRAIALAPQEPTNLALITNLLLDLGATEPARRQLDAALTVGSQNTVVEDVQARYLLVSGRLDELRAMANARLETLGVEVASLERLKPNLWLGQAQLLSGESAAAAENFDTILNEAEVLDPTFTANTLTLSAAAHQGFRSAELSYLESCVAALEGNTQEALAKLIEASDLGWMDVWLAENDPRIATLRGEDVFQTVQRQLGQKAAAALASIDDSELVSNVVGDH